MKRLQRSLVLAALALWTKAAMADGVDPFSQTQRVMDLSAKIVYYIVGLVVAVLALAPFVFGAIMGYKAYNTAKESREGKPETAGIKAFAMWVIITGLISLFAYFFIDNILGNQLSRVVSNMLGVGSGGR